jgi:hypothetical protein
LVLITVTANHDPDRHRFRRRAIAMIATSFVLPTMLAGIVVQVVLVLRSMLY